MVVTANRLTDGAVVFLGPDFRWVESLQGAFLVSEAEREKALARAKADEGLQIVVEPYLIDVIEGDGGIAAKHLREAIRASGPTVRPELGKSFRR